MTKRRRKKPLMPQPQQFLVRNPSKTFTEALKEAVSNTYPAYTAEEAGDGSHDLIIRGPQSLSPGKQKHLYDQLVQASSDKVRLTPITLDEADSISELARERLGARGDIRITESRAARSARKQAERTRNNQTLEERTKTTEPSNGLSETNPRHFMYGVLKDVAERIQGLPLRLGDGKWQQAFATPLVEEARKLGFTDITSFNQLYALTKEETLEARISQAYTNTHEAATNKRTSLLEDERELQTVISTLEKASVATAGDVKKYKGKLKKTTESLQELDEERKTYDTKALELLGRVHTEAQENALAVEAIEARKGLPEELPIYMELNIQQERPSLTVYLPIKATSKEEFVDGLLHDVARADTIESTLTKRSGTVEISPRDGLRTMRFTLPKTPAVGKYLNELSYEVGEVFTNLYHQTTMPEVFADVSILTGMTYERPTNARRVTAPTPVSLTPTPEYSSETAAPIIQELIEEHPGISFPELRDRAEQQGIPLSSARFYTLRKNGHVNIRKEGEKRAARWYPSTD